jgi:hypothetical protein
MLLERSFITGLREIVRLDFLYVGFLINLFLDFAFVGNKVVEEGLVFLVLIFIFAVRGELVGLGIGDIVGGFLERKELFLDDLVLFLCCMAVTEVSFLVKPIIVVNC